MSAVQNGRNGGGIDPPEELGPAPDGARAMLDAEEALDQVERQLQLARERRRELDGVEGALWARRNRLERFLIHARGPAWWRARRKPRQPSASAAQS
jgi:hypothetical protein